MNEKNLDKQLEQMLRQAWPEIEDTGFTKRVLKKLPRRQGLTSVSIVMVMALFGLSAIPAFVCMNNEVLESFRQMALIQSVADIPPLPIIITLLSLMCTWVVVREVT